MKDEQSDLEAAITSSRNAYFAHRAQMQPTPAFLQLFSDAFELGADYARESAPQPNAALADGWMPIETAPNGISVFLYAGQNTPMYCGKKRFGSLGEPQQDFLAWRCDSSGRFASPTHWRPLPAPPTLNASKDQS